MESSRPDVSVVIPCFNHGIYLDECLGSIYSSKTKFKIEIILVNDGSTDPYTINKIKSLENSGIVVVNQPNMGLSEARNSGVSLSNAEFIINLDCDNKLAASFIEDALSIFNSNRDISIIYTDKYFFYEGSTKIKHVRVESFNLNTLLIYNYIDACAVYRKFIWQEAGGFDKNISVFQDWDFWLSCAKIGAVFYHLEKPLYYYRIAKNSMISNAKSENLSNEIGYILQKHNTFLSTHWLQVGNNFRYIVRKPFSHFLRMFFGKQIDIKMRGR